MKPLTGLKRQNAKLKAELAQLMAKYNEQTSDIIKDGLERLLKEGERDRCIFSLVFDMEKLKRWKDPAKELPPADELVRVKWENCLGKLRTTQAVYLPKFHLEVHPDEFRGGADYNEEEDQYYFPEGWYEQHCFDEGGEEPLWRIDRKIIGWQELLPVEDAQSIIQERLYYVVSLKHTKGDLFTLWGPNDAGYCHRLDNAGRYTKAQIDSDPQRYNSCDTDGNIAIPCEELEKIARRYVKVDGDPLYQLTHIEEHLKHETN